MQPIAPPDTGVASPAAGAPRPGGAAVTPARAEAVIDLDAIAANVAALKRHTGRPLMAVVKADGYGHGIVASARAARDGGADWLGVAFVDEALRLREAGDAGPLLCWLAVPGERYAEAVEAGVELSPYSRAELAEIAAAARRAGRPAAVQVKVDSGLGRGGATPDAWAALVDDAVALRDAGVLDVTGVWSHLACSDEPGHPSIRAQTEEFEAAVGCAIAAGLEPRHLHLANSGGTLASPDTWFTMVRPGIAIYGVSPLPGGQSPVPLRPAMTLRATLASVKEVPAGTGVSYGHAYVTPRATRLALVPLGYGDGVLRAASGRGPVLLHGRRFPVAGRVCMDQLVLDIGDLDAAAGDDVVLFGDPRRGEPSANDWADAAGTIGYEIVTRISERVPRRYLRSAADAGEPER